jgi:hypothetical protein
MNTTTHRYVVMTSSAQSKGKWTHIRRNVAVVETDGLGMPKMISDRAKHLVRIVSYSGGLNVGSTDRCAYQVALREAEALAALLNGEAQC